jgi:hypothetical protein
VPPEIAHLCENAPRGNGYALRFVQLPAMPIATNCHRPSRLLVDQTWLADGEEIHRDEVLAHKKKARRLGAGQATIGARWRGALLTNHRGSAIEPVFASVAYCVLLRALFTWVTAVPSFDVARAAREF